MKKHPLFAALALVAALAACGDSKPQEAQLFVTDEGRYLLDGKPIEFSELRDRLRTLKAQKVELHITGSESVKYERVAAAMKVAQEEGMVRVGATTEPHPAASASEAASH